MNFRLNDSEISTLIEMLSIATMMADFNESPTFAPKMYLFHQLEQKIMEHLHHAGYTRMVEYREEGQIYRVTDEMEQNSAIVECYDEFRQESFWEELVIRMADRDLILNIGLTAWEALGEEERRAFTIVEEKRYWSIFEKHGIDHLRIIHPPGEG
jgi:hypothetical protein